VFEQSEDGASIVFMRGGPLLSLLLNAAGVTGGYLFPPLEILDGKFKMSFVGSEQQISDFLEKIDEKGIRYKIIHVTHADFAPNSPLNRLTEKQREVMIAALKFGYFEVPRKISSEELGKKLNMVSSTLSEHLRKGEKRLLIELLNQR
jgi:predicted DNA binding protein